MPHIKRNQQGEIVSLHSEDNDTSLEFLPANHPDIIAFIEQNGQNQDIQLALRESDTDLARASEDLIYLLIKKNVILFTELPEIVQNKLLAREKLRSQLNRESNTSPLSDDETL